MITGFSVKHTFPTRLVEETPSISIKELQRIQGREKLLAAVRNAHPVQSWINATCYSTYLTYDIHFLPGKQSRWSEIETGDVRLYLSCPRCRRRVRKLYCVPGYQTSGNLSDIACRRCHGLRYKSQHSGSRQWWKNIVVPIKRLLRRQEKILSRNPTSRRLAELEGINQSILVLRNRRRSSLRHKGSTADLLKVPGRRSYKDIDFLSGNAGCF